MKKRSIFTPDDLRKEFPEKFEIIKNTKVCDDDWLERIKDEWWVNGDLNAFESKNTILYAQEALNIRDKLLQFGGSIARVWPDMEDGKKILERGQLFLPVGLKMMKGTPCHCHFNSAALWATNSHIEGLSIATGYALSEDGCWRQHSWVVREFPRSYQVIETTVPRVAYFGFIMNKDECNEFYENNT